MDATGVRQSCCASEFIESQLSIFRRGKDTMIICQYVNIFYMSADSVLSDLPKKLRAVKRQNLATQSELQRITGVNQATISRVLNGKIRLVTKRILLLNNYVDMLLGERELSTDIQEAAREFLGVGGSEAELIASIHHSAKLVSGRSI